MNLIDRIRKHFRERHYHKLMMVGFATHPEDDKSNYLPVTAWIYRCNCGMVFYELTEDGIAQVNAGTKYENVIKSVAPLD